MSPDLPDQSDLPRRPRSHRPRLRHTLLAVTAALALAASGTAALGSAAAAAAAATPPPAPAAQGAITGSHTVGYDGYSLLIDGKRSYIWSGEFQYNRLPSPDLWRDELQKMKAAGFNTASIYFDWAYHSPKQGVYDFSGVRDVDKLLDMAAEAGVYVIARPGPYINAEVDGGGFPSWVSALPGKARSTDPAYLAAVDEWTSHIDPILARHQLTNGTGSVILYQVENEYYNNNDDGRAYMSHLESSARAHGITVPFTGNHNGAFATGTGAVDIDGIDSYPQGFNCSNPQNWNNLPNVSQYHRAANQPIFTAEFQGGSFDPWGGPGYDKCRQLTGADFANVFYKNNMAVGATMQNLYMTVGGTSWGWQGDPGVVYSSYDYGAPISETRQLTDKYQQDKLIGYFAQAAQPLTETDQVSSAAPSSSGVVETVRQNPDDGTQFHFLRQATTSSNGTVGTHLAIDLTAGSYTYDDQDSHLAYSAGWTHVGADQSYTAGEFHHTESWTDTAGSDVTVPFTGTAVRWIASTAPNHGLADVYLDGAKVATVDGYSANTVPQQVQYRADNLAAGPHTLRIVATGQKDAAATGTFVGIDAIDQPSPADRAYASIPQQPGTEITLAGRESKTILARYQLGASRLQYSTSELMTNATIGNRDVAVLYGDAGQAGETVLNYPNRPTVSVLDGSVQSTWDQSTGDLRLNYQHQGLARVLITGGQRPLLLLIGDTATAEQFWQTQSANGPVLVRGSSLLRSAAVAGSTLQLTGDNSTASPLEVFAANPGKVTWNGRALKTQATTSGSTLGQLPGPQAVTLPQLTGWKQQSETPEAQPGFDDSSWAVADKTQSNSTTTPVTEPVLFADDYGFHHGDVWYRAHFQGLVGTSGIDLSAITGNSGQYSVWLNGTFLGTTGDGRHTFAFPAGALKDGADNVVSVLLEDAGHNEDWSADDSHKEARGLTGATLIGAPTTAVTWKIQGALGGESLVDPVRGPMNTGGLYGERSGWSLPGYPDSSWAPASLPAANTTPGITWYRTSAALNLPKGQDTSVGLSITDDPSHHYRALIYVNGWQLGRYINDLGPQHSFPIPNGVLNPNGTNSIAIAVWNADAATGGLGAVQLVSYGTQASPLKVATVNSPRYRAADYPSTTHRAGLTLNAPEHLAPATPTQVTATLAVPAGNPEATAAALDLQAPAGWTVTPTTPVTNAKVKPGSSVTASWQVTAPAGAQQPAQSRLTAHAAYRQSGAQQLTDTREVLPAQQTAPPTADTQVSALPFAYSANGWGPVERNQSNGGSGSGDGRTISLNGKTFATGLGTNATSVVGLNLAGHCTKLTATVGVDDEVTHGSVTFSVRADGRTLTTTPVLTHATGPTDLTVDLTGAKNVELVVGDGGDGPSEDHADWANAQLSCH
ncbi:beta-galactosidase [Kitasatospora viridis]|uniref:beta-galactosidase n=1 Tax=Kitasatospora viridis TaxID=281105 RepID=A0A561SDS3_9ACTN|nr:beta-galactosidase [Kitasatospora viridis]TWF72985.1 alpha-galactosidase-like protein [Kitasatospora viridis]